MKITRRQFGRAGAASLATLAMPPVVGRALAEMPKAEVKDSLVVYAGTGLQTSLMDALAEPYADYMQKKYGVAVKAQNVVGQIPASWARLKTEWPNPSGDVYQLYNENVREGAANGYFLPLKTAYSDEEWARFDPDALASMGTGDYCAPVSISAAVLIVQDDITDKIDSWAVLGDPRYKGRITFNSALSVGSGYDMVLAAALTVGSDYHSWFTDAGFDADAAMPAFQECARWARNALTLTQGSGSITPLVRRKEALISAWWWHNGEDEIARGTPVRIVFPKEGCPASVDCGPVVSSKTTNPVAALEWVKFYHSDLADDLAVKLKQYNRVPRLGEEPNDHWKNFVGTSKIAWSTEFRQLTIGPKYNKQVLDLYNRVVIQGQ